MQKPIGFTGRHSVSDTTNQLLAWVLGVSLFLVFALPFGIWVVRRVAHKKRRRLEQSRRQIVVAAEPGVAGQKECPHKRSKSRAKTGPDGQMTSICRFCGIPMLRLGPGDWEVLAAGPPD
jgi:hypothetical protein